MFTVTASEFKAKCLQIMDELQDTVVITKHGKPVAKISPYHPPKDGIYGFLQGQMRYKPGLEKIRDDSWSAWDEERNL